MREREEVRGRLEENCPSELQQKTWGWEYLTRRGILGSKGSRSITLGMVPGNLLLVALLEQGFGPDHLQRSLLTSTIL